MRTDRTSFRKNPKSFSDFFVCLNCFVQLKGQAYLTRALLKEEGRRLVFYIPRRKGNYLFIIRKRVVGFSCTIVGIPPVF